MLSFQPGATLGIGVIEAFGGGGKEGAARLGKSEEVEVGIVVVPHGPGASLGVRIVQSLAGYEEQFVLEVQKVHDFPDAGIVVSHHPCASVGCGVVDGIARRIDTDEFLTYFYYLRHNNYYF